MNTTGYVNEKEVSRYTSIGLSKLRSDRQHARGIPFSRFGRRVVYRIDDVEAYLDRNRVQTVDE
jgi:hypothetical protein